MCFIICGSNIIYLLWSINFIQKLILFFKTLEKGWKSENDD